MSSFKPTEEQVAIADAVMDKSVRHISINAGAGTGKTSTFKYLSREVIPIDKTILFGAYNKAIKETLNTFIKTDLKPLGKDWKTQARTFNGMGFKAMSSRMNVDSDYLIRKGRENKYKTLIGEWVSSNMSYLPEDQADMAVDLIEGAFNMFRANTTFERSGSRTPVVLNGYSNNQPIYTRHDPKDENLILSIASRYGLLGKMDDFEHEERALRAIPYIMQRGMEMLYTDHTWTFTDQVYYAVVDKWKIWGVDWLLVDECQDLSPLFRAIVDMHVWNNTRLIMVGDPQQAIYAFTGADNRGFENSMRFWNIQEAMPLSVSWRNPKKVVELVRPWKPEFKAAPNAIDGDVIEINQQWAIENAGAEEGNQWAFISRTRGPLIPMWQKLIAKGKAAIIVGSDVSSMIIKVLESIAKKKGFKFEEIDSALIAYTSARVDRMKRKQKDQSEIDSFLDQMSSVSAAIDAVEAETIEEMKEKIKALFARENDSGELPKDKILIMTGHGSKGLEFPHVVVMTPMLFPMSYPNQSHEQYVQEKNLEYVVKTRAMKTLYMMTDVDKPKEVLIELPKEEIVTFDDDSPLLLADTTPAHFNIPALPESVQELLDACINYTDSVSSNAKMLARLVSLAKMAQEIKDGSSTGESETVDEIVHMGERHTAPNEQ